jgi:hypothetical protein
MERYSISAEGSVTMLVPEWINRHDHVYCHILELEDIGMMGMAYHGMM